MQTYNPSNVRITFTDKAGRVEVFAPLISLPASGAVARVKRGQKLSKRRRRAAMVAGRRLDLFASTVATDVGGFPRFSTDDAVDVAVRDFVLKGGRLLV